MWLKSCGRLSLRKNGDGDNGHANGQDPHSQSDRHRGIVINRYAAGQKAHGIQYVSRYDRRQRSCRWHDETPSNQPQSCYLRFCHRASRHFWILSLRNDTGTAPFSTALRFEPRNEHPELGATTSD
jgi:hypothetical protein